MIITNNIIAYNNAILQRGGKQVSGHMYINNSYHLKSMIHGFRICDNYHRLDPSGSFKFEMFTTSLVAAVHKVKGHYGCM